MAADEIERFRREIAERSGDARPFGTQLLCEQVIGRALRRQSYELDAENLFNVEYADVFGIPFDSRPSPPSPRRSRRAKPYRSRPSAPSATPSKSASRASKAIESSCPRSASLPSSTTTPSASAWPAMGSSRSSRRSARAEKKLPYDKELYRGRHCLERFFHKLKQFRRIATRYDKAAKTFFAGIHLVAAFLLIRIS